MDTAIGDDSQQSGFDCRRAERALFSRTPTWLCERAHEDLRRGKMPQFMDFHDDLKLPDDAIAQITQEAKEHKADQYGVRQVELFHNADGKVYCLLEAPDADAVRSHHEALGVPCGEVHPVAGIL
jgi:hypothetical protein